MNLHLSFLPGDDYQGKVGSETNILVGCDQLHLLIQILDSIRFQEFWITNISGKNRLIS